MTNKNKKRLLLGLCCALVASTFPVGFSACFTSGGDSSNSSTSEMQTEKYEGSFYADKEGGEGIYELAFTEDGVITYSEGGNKKIGTFVKADKEFLIAFNDGTTASAELVNKNILFTYGDLKITFIEKIEYTVTFNVDGATTKVTKYNGQQVAAPEAPEKVGYKFVGWYMDQKYTKPYVFATPVTKDVTLYARFIEVDENAEVFTVNFVVDGKAYGEPVQTEAGIVAELPTPTKEGATFAGWWMSGSNEEAKLTAKYDGQMIQEDITLFAVWASDAPAVSVSEKGVVWTAAGQNNNYKVEITKPDGTKKSATLADNYYDYDFTAEVAGEYVVTVTLNGKTTTMYYQNKKLAKICKVEVDDSTSWLLKWNEIEGAEKYLVTIECGDAAHQHTQVEVTNPYYDFTNCTMQKGGVKLVVEAVAEGYTGSVSDAYYFSKDLAAAATVQVEGDKTLTWTAVENAEGYKVEITAGDKTETVNVTGTNYSLENYTGALTFKVTPYAKGYNSPDVTEVNYTKVALAKPTGVKLTEQTVTWDAMAGATGYVVNVDGKTYTTTETKFDLMGAEIDPNATNCKVQVMATGATAAANSVYSNEITVTFGQMADTLTYKNGKVYWDPVINVTQYAVQINGGTVYRVDKAEHSYTPIFTSTGAQKISVRCYDAQGVASEWVHLTVTTAEVTFDAQNGEEVDPIYQVEGDVIALPEGVREGYTFDGWYTNPNGEGGDKFDSYTMTAEGANLFAHWTANKYKITLNLDGGEMEKTEVEVTYDSLYNLGIPTNPNTTKVFVGWFSEKNSEGLQYADYLGNGVGLMKDTKPLQLYAGWKDAFVFTLDTDGEGYSVKQVEGIDVYTDEITIPATYQDKPVTRIEADAFKNSDIVTVNIPDTIKEIFVGTQGPSGAGHAFYGCYYVEDVNVYKVEGDHEVAYESIDGVLYKVSALDAETATKELIYFPRGKTYKAEIANYAIPEGVTYIGMRVFYSAKIAHLTLPASLAVIGAEAFYLSDIKEIDFAKTPEGQEPVELTIETSAFKSSDLLTKITLPERLTNLETSLFTGCSDLMEIHVEGEGKYKSSEDGILLNANGTEIVYFPLGRGGEYVIPEGITSIAAGAFTGNKNITKLVIPNHVVYIGVEAFKSCTVLTTLTFEGTRTDLPLTIDESAFYGCTSVVELTLPANLGILKAHAFGGTTNLKTVTMNTTDMAVELAEKAFGTKPSTSTGVINYYVESLYLGAEVVPFDLGGVFGQKINSVTVDKNNKNLTSLDGVLYDGKITTILYYPHEKQGAYVTPASLTTIGANIFKNHKYLTSVTIGKNVTSIGSYAFASCTTLTEIIFEDGGTEDLTIGDYAFESADFSALNLPSRTTQIGASAFKNCDYVTEIELPKGLTTIGDNAFQNCNILAKISIPSTVTTIGNLVFDNCNELSGLTVATDNEKYAAEGGILYAKAEGVLVELIVCPRGVAGIVNVPKTVTKIADQAFYQNTKVTEVIFSDDFEGTLEFGNKVFYQSILLKRVVLPEGLTEITTNLFQYCTSLEEIVIPSTISSIKNNAFANCTALAKITFNPTPEGQKEVPLTFEDAKSGYYSPFYKCTSLKELRFPERTVKIGAYLFGRYSTGGSSGPVENTDSALEKVYIPTSVAELGKYAFYYAPIKELEFAETTNLTSIPYYAFGGLQITELTLPEGLVNLGTADSYSDGSAFYSNKKLTTVNLPSTLENIYYNAFYYSEALTTVNFPNGSNLKYIGQNAFGSCFAMTSFTVPASVETVGSQAFYNNKNMTSVTFAEGTKVKNINKQAFQNSGLTSFTFPETEEPITLGTDLFSGCKGLTQVHLSTSVTGIDNVFTNCPNLKKITIAEGHEFFKEHGTLPIITNVAGDAIHYIYGEISGEFIIPEGYTEIAPRAFADQKQLTKLIIPKTMRIIGDNAFLNCSRLETVIFSEDCLLNELGMAAFSGCGVLKAIAIPEGVTRIEGDTFYKCANLADVTLGSAIEYIGEDAFMYTTNLKKIDLPDSLVTTGNNAFKYSGLEEITLPANYQPTSASAGNSIFHSCENLKKVTLNDGLEILVNSMFNGCTSLEEIKIPTSVTLIGSSAFSGCTSLEKVDLTGCANLTKVDGSAFARTASLKNISFADCTSLTEFGASVFASTKKTDATTKETIVTDPSGLMSIVLPDSVTKFGASVFSYCQSLESINLPKNDAFTILGNNMFEGCIKLTEIDLPESLKFLGKGTFAKSGLTKVTIPTSVEMLGTAEKVCKAYASTCKPEDTLNASNDVGLFWMCKNLEEVTLHTGLTKIGNRVFDGCTSLKTISNIEQVTLIGRYAFRGTLIEEINLPSITNSAGADLGYGVFADATKLKTVTMDSLQRVSNYMFQNCTALEAIALPKIGTKTTAATYGTYAFQGCTALKEVTLDANLKYIPNYMFDGCTALETITLPEKLTTIGSYAFRNTGLKTVEIPAPVTKVDTYAFFGSAIESVNIPAKLTTINNVAFGNCQNLTAFTVDEANKTFQAVQGALAKGTTLVCYPAGAPYVETLTLPEGTVLGSYAFYGCENIKKLVLPQSMNSIPTYAFDYFLGEEIVLPETCTSIFGYAFRNTTNLKKVNLPEGLTLINANLFQNSGIEEITIPSTVTSIATSAFQGSMLKSIVIPDGVVFEKYKTKQFADCVQLKTATLPKGYTIIPDYFFQNCTALETVTFSDELTAINQYAFAGCTNLKEINIPETVTTIGQYAFSKTGFTTFKVPATVTSLGASIFRDSVLLETVVFEEPVKEEGATEEETIVGLNNLPAYSFYGCTALKNVTLSSTMVTINNYAFAFSGLTEWTIPATVTKVGQYAFSGSAIKNITFTNGYATYSTYMFQNCTALESVELPEGMVELPGYTFEGCTSLKSVKLPSSLEKIQYKVFWNCAELESINIPETVTYINWETFLGCTKLKSIVIPAGVTTLGRDVFNGWTADQTIYFLGEEGDYKANTTFNTEWNNECAAKIVWNYQPQA